MYIVYNMNVFEINLKIFDCNVNVFRNSVYILLIIYVCMLWMYFKIEFSYESLLDYGRY